MGDIEVIPGYIDRQKSSGPISRATFDELHGAGYCRYERHRHEIEYPTNHYAGEMRNPR